MNQAKMDLFSSYVYANVAPILTSYVPIELLNQAIIIPACVSKEALNGFYDKNVFKVPSWIKILHSRKDLPASFLVIDDITSISKEEQIKFRELIKYRKINSFKLPDNCVVIVIAKNISKETINSELYSLMAHV